MCNGFKGRSISQKVSLEVCLASRFWMIRGEKYGYRTKTLQPHFKTEQ
jgi:hypothetical protein